MARRIVVLLAVLALPALGGFRALACSLCSGQQSATLRQDAAQARLVLYGTLLNPRLNAGADALTAGGTTDLRIERVLKADPFLGDKKVIELPRYVPVDPKNPPKFLVFCDVFNGKLDPYRGAPVKSAAVADYLKGALALDPTNRTESLLYFFNYLEHPDPEVATDAYLEFAKASDQDVGQVAAKFSPDKLRTWLQDPQTPASRLGLYGFLLGACGGDRDAALLHALVQNPTERTAGALGGLLSGYIQLRPRDGWELALARLRDNRRPFTERFAVLGMLRFYQGWKPEETRREILRCSAVVLGQSDLADLAVEDLRRWQMWDLTGDVLALYGKKDFDAPIQRRAVVRYALSCPRPEAGRFLTALRQQDPDLVKEVEEALQFEKP
jgi:hypothetical protein